VDIFCDEFSPNQLRQPENMDKISVAPLKYSIAFIAPIFKNFIILSGIIWKARVLNFTQIVIKYGKYGQKLFYARM